MGCGISKIDPEEAGGRPASAFKRLPKRNVNATVDDNPVVSEKVTENTLREEEADYFVTQYGRKSVSSSPAAALGNGSVVAERDIQAMNAKKDNSEKKDQRGVGEYDYDRMPVAKAMAADDNEGEEESFYQDNSFFCPGSPSFREYCVDYGSSKDKNEGRNNASEENDPAGEGALTSEKAEEERCLNSEMVHRAAQERSNKKSSRKGFRNALHRPAGWIGKSKCKK